MKSYTDFSEFKSIFANGDRSFNPVVMWFWNDKIDEYEINYQLEQFKEKEIYQFFIHPMYGLELEYLSERFFELIRYTVKEAKRLSMKFWIYDEYNWPSGSAGGFLLRDEPWTCGLTARACKVHVKENCETIVSFEGEFLSAFAFFDESNLTNNTNNMECNEGNTAKIYEVTEQVTVNEDGRKVFVKWKNTFSCNCSFMVCFAEKTNVVLPSARWSQFTWNQEGYLDVCNGKAVKKFIEYTHEKYKKAVGEEFGKTVQGVFTDEVAACSPRSGETTNMTAWSREFPAEFIKRRGYDIRTKLYTLFIECLNDEVVFTRYDFWRTISELYCENYMKFTSEWCIKNDLQYTGHFAGEEYLIWHTISMTDMFEALSYLTIPGFDSIFSSELIKRYDFNIAGKLVSSAAHFQGKRRVLCEVYTGSGWCMNMSLMKKIANRLLILGANMFQYMGAYYSLKGFRKALPGGYPPSHSYNNILFEHYPNLNRYISRMSYISQITEPCGRILMMYPSNTGRVLLGGEYMWDYLNPSHVLRKYDLTAQGVVNTLLALNRSFEIGFEQLMNEAEVDNGRIKVRGLEYEALILPGMTYTISSVVKVAERFALAGGKVVFVNGMPEKILDYKTDYMFYEVFGIDKARAEEGFLKAFGENAKPYSDVIRGREDTWLIISNEFGCSEDTADKKDILYTLINKCLEGFGPDTFEIEPCDNIFSSHRRAGDIHIFTIVNDCEDEKQVRGSINLPYPVAVFEPDSGMERSVELNKVEKETTFNIRLSGYESVVMVCGGGVKATAPFYPAKEVKKTQVLSDGWCFETLTPNWVVLKPALVKNADDIIAATETGNVYKLEDICNKLKNKEKLTCKTWEVPVGSNLIPGSRFTAVYEFNVNYLPENDIELVTEDDYPVSWYLNGKAVIDFCRKRLWDGDNNVANVKNMLKEGRNWLIAIGELPSYDAPHYLPFAALTGDFAFDEEKNTISRPCRLIKAAPWNGQGYPHYSGKGVYSNIFNLEGEIEYAGIFLNTNDVVSLRINNYEAGTRLWPPYEFNITPFLKEGENFIELEFTSTMGNRFGEPVESGLLKPPVLFFK